MFNIGADKTHSWFGNKSRHDSASHDNEVIKRSIHKNRKYNLPFETAKLRCDNVHEQWKINLVHFRNMTDMKRSWVKEIKIENTNDIQVLKEDIQSLQEISSVMSHAVDDLQKAAISNNQEKLSLPIIDRIEQQNIYPLYQNDATDPTMYSTQNIDLDIEYAKQLGAEYCPSLENFSLNSILKALHNEIHVEQMEKDELQVKVKEMNLQMNALRSQVKLQYSAIIRLKNAAKVKEDTMQNKATEDKDIIEGLQERIRKIQCQKQEYPMNEQKLRQAKSDELLKTQMELANTESVVHEQLYEIKKWKEDIIMHNQYRTRQNQNVNQHIHNTEEANQLNQEITRMKNEIDKLMIDIKEANNDADVANKKLLKAQEHINELDMKSSIDISKQTSELKLVIEQKDKDLYSLGEELKSYKSLAVANESKITSLFDNLKQTEVDMKTLQQHLQFTKTDHSRLKKGSAEYLIDLRKAYSKKLKEITEEKDVANQSLKQALTESQEDLTKSKKDLQSNIISMVKQADELQKELIDTKEDMNILKRSLEKQIKLSLNMESKVHESNSIIENLTIEKESLTENPILKQKLAELVGELEKTKEELQATQSTLEVKTKKEQEMELKLHSSSIGMDSIPDLTNQLTESQNEVTKTKLELENMKIDLDSKETENCEMRKKLVQSSSVIENLTIEKESLTENPILKQKLAELVGELAKTKEVLQATQSSLEIKTKKEQETELKLSTPSIFINSIPVLTDQLTESQEELAKIKLELENMKINLGSKEIENREMRIELKAQSSSVIENLTIEKESLTENPILKQKLAELVGELAKTKEELQATQSSLEVKTKKEQEMELKLNRSSIVIESIPVLTNQLVESQEELTKIKLELKNMKNDLDSKEADNCDMRIELCQSSTLIENLTLEKVSLTAENPILKQQLAELVGELAKSKEQLQGTQSLDIKTNAKEKKSETSFIKHYLTESNEPLIIQDEEGDESGSSSPRRVSSITKNTEENDTNKLQTKKLSITSIEQDSNHFVEHVTFDNQQPTSSSFNINNNGVNDVYEIEGDILNESWNSDDSISTDDDFYSDADELLQSNDDNNNGTLNMIQGVLSSLRSLVRNDNNESASMEGVPDENDKSSKTSVVLGL